MLGMHGTYEANMAMHDCDVMIAIGARFDDRITGRLDAFSPNSKRIHIDIDPSSIGKNVRADIPIIGDCAYVMEDLDCGVEVTSTPGGQICPQAVVEADRHLAGPQITRLQEVR